MRLNKLSVRDKSIFDSYLKLDTHQLSVYSFANIYIWNKLFSITWAVIEDSLCIFFRDKIGGFLYLPPLPNKNNPRTLSRIFDILAGLNKNPEFAHIENVEEKDLAFYRNLGFECPLKSYDYICCRQDLEELKGNKFKSKRASRNYFSKNFEYRYQPISFKNRKECLELYSLWEKQRKISNPGPIYRGMLEDGKTALGEALKNYSRLGFKGSLVRIKNKVKAFTFGFELNKGTFCILYEITDLSIKGLAQFIFSRFSGELKDYKYINIMDDSGLDNLKKVKLSYHPKFLLPAYSVRRNG